MLVDLKAVLGIAEAKKCAIGSFNVCSLENLMAVTEAAEELNVPVVIQFAEIHESVMPIDVIGPVMVSAAKRAAVPVCVHLDHGETFGFMKKALDIGFTSVMYDGSTLPYEENAANTRVAVQMARQYGACVEAEIGSMGAREMGSRGSDGEDPEAGTKAQYTSPEEAGRFVRETGIDALACSFGTAHGLYARKPVLSLPVLEDVVKNVNIPIVMHGGSGLSPEAFRSCIERGVRKINYFSYMSKAGGEAVEKYIRESSGVIFFHDVESIGRKAMKENVKEAMRVFADI